MKDINNGAFRFETSQPLLIFDEIFYRMIRTIKIDSLCCIKNFSQGHQVGTHSKIFQLQQNQVDQNKQNHSQLLRKHPQNCKFLSSCKGGEKSGEMNSEPIDVFEGVADRFRGMTIESRNEYEKCKNFPEKLRKSLELWTKHKIRCVWFRVRSQHNDWIPELIKEKFDFHNAHRGVVVLYKWLAADEDDKIPVFAHTMIGAGGVVLNDKNEILVVSEKYATVKGSFKLPGGYVDPGENLIDAAIREIEEETNIKCVFESLIAIRHTHKANFNCSDLYVVMALKPCTFSPLADNQEIVQVGWMSIQEYLEHPLIHSLNKCMLRKYLSQKERQIRIVKTDHHHPVLKKWVQLYHLEEPEDEDSHMGTCPNI